VTVSLRTANFATLVKLPRDHYEVGDWSIMIDGYGTVWISKQKLGYPPTDHIEIPRKVFNRLVDAYQHERKPSRR